MSFPKKRIGGLSEDSSRRLFILVAIILLGAALRLAAMNGRVLLGDEVGTALGTAQTYGQIMSRFSGWNTQPAYYFAARLSSQILSPGEFALRLPSLLFGLGGIIAIYFLASRLFDKRIGLVSALLLALSPYHLFYSQMARGYAMAATLSMLSFVWLLRFLDRRSLTDAVLYVLSTTVAIYCHLGCIGIVPGQIVMALLIAYRRRGEARPVRTLLPIAFSVAVVGILILALYYPAMSEMLAYGRRFSGQTERGFTLGFVPLLLATYMGGRGWSIYIFSLFAALGFARLLRRGRADALLLVTWAGGVLLFYFLTDSRVYPWAYTRFFFITLPALIIVAAAGLVAAADTLTDRPGGRFASASIPLCILPVIFIFMTSTKTVEISFGKKDTRWPDVITELEALFPPGAPIASLFIGSNSFKYYYGRAWPDGNRVFGPKMIIDGLRANDVAPEARVPVVYVVDIVPLDDEQAGEGFIKVKNGTSTILYRRDWRNAHLSRRLADMEIMAAGIIRYLEERQSERITSDWVYWRRGPKNQKMFASRGSLSLYYSLLAATQEAQGKREPARNSNRKAVEWSRKVRMPEEVRASWSMLLPHADFLKICGGCE